MSTPPIIATYLIETPIAVEQAAELMAGWADNAPAEQRREIATNQRTFGRVEQLIAMTGSCSPVNDRQIAWAEQNHFETVPIDAARLIDEYTSCTEIELVTDRALELLKCGASLICTQVVVLATLASHRHFRR